jgi:hypothetical protein
MGKNRGLVLFLPTAGAKTEVWFSSCRRREQKQTSDSLPADGGSKNRGLILFLPTAGAKTEV